MAGASLLALLDDITTMLDDIAVLTKATGGKIGAVADDMATMTKLATKKTAGVLGDDLALNAQQVTGVATDRELPVVWAVLRGSLVNKAILVPAALLISALAPWAITPLLMVGGLYLCYEGFEKVAHRLIPSGPREDEAARERRAAERLARVAADPAGYERQQVRGAVRTDFILSAEIVAIVLGTVAGLPFIEQLGVLVAVSLLVTFGVYGAVAGIVRLDDVGAYLQRIGRAGGAARWLGRRIVLATPWLMSGLSILGTLAMFIVGGGILAHGWHVLAEWMSSVQPRQPVLGTLVNVVLTAVLGLLAGAVTMLAVGLVSRLRSAMRR